MSSRVLVNVTRFVALLLFLALALFILTPGLYQRFVRYHDIPCVASITGSNEEMERLLFRQPKSGETGIYFLETSGSSSLNLRQACSVEAAARSHPTTKVFVFISSFRANVGEPAMKALIKLNVSFSFLDQAALFTDTVLEDFFAKDKLANSKYPIEHASDILRLILLWKYGGIYMDLDAITLRPMDKLRNILAIGDAKGEELDNGVMMFDKGHPFLRHCLQLLDHNFRGDKWIHNGPGTLKQVVNEKCKNSSLISTINSTVYISPGDFNHCVGLRVLSAQSFYPIHWINHTTFFQPKFPKAEYLSITKFNDKSQEASYSIHLYNKLNANTPVKIGSGQLYEALAESYCPDIYKIMRLEKTF